MMEFNEPFKGTKRMHASKSEDLRVIKTKRVLTSAIFALLSRKKFDDITVNNLCETAAVSRATFYSHFRDKYDLLRYCLKCVRREFMLYINDLPQMEAVISQFFQENSRMVINIVDYANYETLEILFETMMSFVHTFARHRSPKKSIDNLMTLFCAGGLVGLQFWRVKNNFQPKTTSITPFVTQTLEILMKTYAQEE